MSTTQPSGTKLQEKSGTTAATTENDSCWPLTDITVELVGHDGNAYAILARVCHALRQGGRRDLIQPFMDEATSGDYDHLLATCHKFVEVE